jgi:uncharacterized protein involved in exopolysaccharide biosynthesis
VAGFAEREVDLGGWRRAVARVWWLVVGGVVAGAVAGVLYSSRHGSTYKAVALVSLGQVTSPAGDAINTFAVDPRAVAQIVRSSAAQAEAAARAGVPASLLAGRVSVARVGAASSGTVGGHGPLVSLTVTGSRPRRLAAAANALAGIVVRQTTQPYVRARIAAFEATLRSLEAQLASTAAGQRAVERSLRQRRRLAPLEQLVAVGELSNLEARQGDLIAQQGRLKTQLWFATNIDSARVLEPAQATKANAHPRPLSLLVGALIGLTLTALAVITANPPGTTPPRR